MNAEEKGCFEEGYTQNQGELKDHNNNMGSNDYLGTDRPETKLAAHVRTQISPKFVI